MELYLFELYNSCSWTLGDDKQTNPSSILQLFVGCFVKKMKTELENRPEDGRKKNEASDRTSVSYR